MKKHYYIKSDEFYLNEKSNQAPGPDAFKKVHKPIHKKTEMDMNWTKPVSLYSS